MIQIYHFVRIFPFSNIQYTALCTVYIVSTLYALLPPNLLLFVHICVQCIVYMCCSLLCFYLP